MLLRFPRRLGAAALAALLLAPWPALAAASPLETLLRAFAGREDEKAMQKLPGIVWKGVSYPADSERDGSYVLVLAGQLLLSGFGEVDVPMGVGASQTTARRNEGEARFEVRISTSKQPGIGGPQRIDLFKLYPSADYQAILTREIPGGTVVLMADGCTMDALGRPAEREHAAWFRIDLPGTPTPVFVRATRNEEGNKNGPGETGFAFSLFTPGALLAKGGCTLRLPPGR